MIIFLTDTGDYANIMKAVIKSLRPRAEFMDLSNNISPHNIIEGAWLLYNNYHYFPKGSIFLCVVDPGVGSDRKGIIIHSKDYVFIGPDNGLMYSAANDNKIMRAFEINKRTASALARAAFLKKYRLSKTFEGRDIFSVVAASLENDLNMQFMGSYVKVENKLDVTPKKKKGMVVQVDHYGNIITNLTPKSEKIKIKIKNDIHVLKLRETYSEAKRNELFAIIGSNGTLEISKKEASANKKLKCKPGDIAEII